MANSSPPRLPVWLLLPSILAAASVMAQNPAPDAVVTKESDLRALWGIVASLEWAPTPGAPRRLVQQQLEQLDQPLRAAQALLARYERCPAVVWWDGVWLLLQDAHYARLDQERNTALEALDAELANLRATLVDLSPPVVAFEEANDKGDKINIAWRRVADAPGYLIERQEVERDGTPKEDWRIVKREPGTIAQFKDEYRLRTMHHYRYRVRVDEDGGPELGTSAIVQARPDLVHMGRLWFLGFLLVLCGAVMFYIELARRGVPLKVRKIAGLEAVDEAVGRATEMGRPILFVPGIQDMNDIQTVAGLIILGRVARTAAEHDALLEVPTSRSLVMTAARETVQASYISAGRPDAFDEKRIYYTTNEQFGYVAAVTGVMVREKPATCFYMGAFFAESLILAETANTTGSIQIAGTAQPAQLPFFVAACDYTLIGEEFFAASAYLSGEPQQLGSLKGQDVGKLIVLILLGVGITLATLSELFGARYQWVGGVLHFLQQNILSSAT